MHALQAVSEWAGTITSACGHQPRLVVLVFCIRQPVAFLFLTSVTPARGHSYCSLLTGHVLAGLVASWFLGWGWTSQCSGSGFKFQTAAGVCCLEQWRGCVAPSRRRPVWLATAGLISLCFSEALPACGESSPEFYYLPQSPAVPCRGNLRGKGLFWLTALRSQSVTEGSQE